MGFDIDVLLNDITTEYRQLKRQKWDLDSIALSSEHIKNNSKATIFLNQGNSEYERGQYYKALELYTRSIASAEEHSEVITKAYTNRSAVSFYLGRYSECLLDVNRALNEEYPGNWRQKLLDRKEKCVRKIELKNTRVVNGDERDRSRSKDDNFSSNWEFKNTLLPNVSSKIEASYDEQWGRHLLATDDIEPGEILSSQEFYSAILAFDRRFTNCSYCFMRCDALIPCPSCSVMMFCSENCRDLAFNAYHRIECRMLPLMRYDINNANNVNFVLALRTLLVGTEQGARLEHLVTSSDIRRDIFKEKVDNSKKAFKHDYFSMLRIRLTFERLPKIRLIVLTVGQLQHLSFFKNNANPDSMSPAESFVALALLNHMYSIQNYNYTITETTYNGECKIGFGIDPFYSLINHSCDPNVYNLSMHGRKQLMFSLRPIKRGEQIFTSYCPSFAHCDLAVRQHILLSSFEFNCQCKACSNNWPLLMKLMHQKVELVVRNEKLKKDIEKIISWIMTIDPETYGEIETFSKVIKHRKMIGNNVRAPSHVIVCTEMQIMTCLNWRYGMAYYTNTANNNNLVAPNFLDETQKMFERFHP